MTSSDGPDSVKPDTRIRECMSPVGHGSAEYGQPGERAGSADKEVRPGDRRARRPGLRRLA